jgi:hypothetical protein
MSDRFDRDLTPEKAALMLSYAIGEDPAQLAVAIGMIEEWRSSWWYRLFSGRWRKQMDQHLVERLVAKTVQS